MESDTPAFLKGQFLMAMPNLADPNFSHTVTCICEHTSEGAVGVVVNRIFSPLTGKDIFDELKIETRPDAESIPVHIGGPVHVNEVFVLHGPPFGWQGCRMVTPFLAMSNTRDILEALSTERGPNSFIIALGCAGWGPNQLESEIKANSWLTAPIVEEIIFQLPVDTRWEEAVKRVGIDPASLSYTAGHA
jgi:putative transcriptional regulator